jgi:DNA-binding HxlR family transcriptional regulator
VRSITTSRSYDDFDIRSSRRWALGVVWALRDRALGFSQLQAELGGVSTSVLALSRLA